MTAKQFPLPAFGSFIVGQCGFLAAILRGPTVDGVKQPSFALLVSDKAVGEGMAAWGKYGEEVPNAGSRTDGLANTAAMAETQCPAALLVRALDLDGHKDWYLPSLGELNSAAANVPEQFDTDGWYWTSTQDSRHFAFVQDFEFGFSGWGDRGYEHRVRAFRRIPLELLNA